MRLTRKVAVTTVLMAAMAGPAHASTMSSGGNSSYSWLGTDWAYVAEPGEANRVTVAFTPDAVVLVDRGIPQVDAGSGCQATADPQRVECAISRRNGNRILSATAAVVDTGDGNDEVTTVNDTDGMTWAGEPLGPWITPGVIPDSVKLIGGDGDDKLTGGDAYDWVMGAGDDDQVDGGDSHDFAIGGYDFVHFPNRTEADRDDDGDDVVNGGPGDDSVDGGVGRDTIRGGDGDDFLAGGLDADTYSGGPGTDIVAFTGGIDFYGRTLDEPFTGDIGGGANDGGASDGPVGARDDIRVDVEGIRGGLKEDRLTGNGDPNSLDGSGGDDVIEGGGGDDVLSGGMAWIGSNVAPHESDRDTVRGGEGNDAIDGGDDRDDLDGGTGDDLIDGGNTFAGGGDNIVGGPGDDRLFGGHATFFLNGAPRQIWPDGPDVFDGGEGQDTVVSRDAIWDRDACYAQWAGSFDGGAFCGDIETPQNCKPGSSICDTAFDTGTCGPASDVAYTDGDDQLTDCETANPDRPVPAAASGLADGQNPVGTSNSGGGASSAQMVETALTSPVQGGVVVEQAPQPAQRDGGNELLPVGVFTKAPPTDAAHPLTLKLSVDAPRVPSDTGAIGVLHNGARVANCTGPDGQATPDPCVSSRARVSGGDASLTVLSSAGGAWRLSVPGGTAGAGGSASAGSGETADTIRPTLGLRLGSRYSLRTLLRGLRVPVTCSERCQATVELRLSGRTAKKLGLKTIVGSKRQALRNRGGVTVKLTGKAAKKLRRQRRGFALLVVAKATDGAGNKARTAGKRISVR